MTRAREKALEESGLSHGHITEASCCKDKGAVGFLRQFPEAVPLGSSLGQFPWAVLAGAWCEAFGITSGQPYMVNMAFDPMMAGCLIYLIQAVLGNCLGKFCEASAL